MMKANRAAQTLCPPTGAACTQLGVPVPHMAVPGGSLPTEMTDAALSQVTEVNVNSQRSR